jgi:PAS domain S-box-containing protein
MDESSKRIFDLLPQSIGSTDPELRCRYANRAYAELLGRSPDAMIGLPVRELWGEKLIAEVLPFIKRAQSGERLAFSKRIVHINGEKRFGKVDMIPEEDGGYSVVIHDLDAVERHFRDRDRLVHELDHRVNNILQITQSVLALESQSADGKTLEVLGSIKARVDALSLSYELASGTEPRGGWPAAIVLERVASSIGPGISAHCASDPKLRISHANIENFVFIATEVARWASMDGKEARLEARHVPEGLELAAVCEDGADLTTKAGAAGMALVDSFARRCGAGPIRGGRRVAIIFPLAARRDPSSED